MIPSIIVLFWCFKLFLIFFWSVSSAKAKLLIPLWTKLKVCFGILHFGWGSLIRTFFSSPLFFLSHKWIFLFWHVGCEVIWRFTVYNLAVLFLFLPFSILNKRYCDLSFEKVSQVITPWFLRALKEHHILVFWRLFIFHSRSVYSFWPLTQLLILYSRLPTFIMYKFIMKSIQDFPELLWSTFLSSFTLYMILYNFEKITCIRPSLSNFLEKTALCSEAGNLAELVRETLDQ